jgi:succinoglycan biosynthesis transport protein ExoP
MELRNYIDIILRRKWVIILTAAATMIVVVIGTQLQTPVYQASTTLRIATSAGGQLDYSDYLYADRLMNTYVEIAISEPVLTELVKRLDMSEPPTVTADIIPNTELIKITVDDTNPKRAAMTANTLTDILIVQGNQLYSGGGKNSLDVLSEQLTQIQPNLDQARREYEKLAIQTPAAPEKIEAARQSLQLQQNTYATLLAQYNEAQYRQEIQASMITVVEPATTQQASNKSKVLLNYALGLLVGLAGGVGLVFVFENLDTTLYTTEDIETATELTALAKIPKAHKKQINVIQEGYSQLADAFLDLASNIQITDQQPTKKVLLIMSAEPKQGKSMAVQHLAVSLAEFGKNVIAVDCDVRLPKLHTLFALPNDRGLTDILDQKVSLKDALQVSSFDGVTVLTSGALPPYPPKLLGSPQMVNLIDDLKRQFDYVILDTPAILATTDLTGVVPNVDALLFIVRRGHARREALHAAKRVLAGFRFRNKPIDLIVNQAENSRDYDYYQYHRKSNLHTTKSEHKTPIV